MNRPLLHQPSVDRRTVVVAFSSLAGAFAAAALLPSVALAGAAENGPSPATSVVRFNAWVTIAADGTVSIASPAMEMGQGSRTSLPLILAEELDAEWSEVKIVTAAPSDAVFGNPKFFQLMYTAGSSSVTGYYDELRLFGARVRRVLIDNAARHWQVPASELMTRPSEVVHRQSGRQMSYGDIARFAQPPATAPVITPADLKSPSEFRLIGRDVMRRDVPSKVNGSARYSIDVEIPGMLYAAVLHPPVDGSEPVSIKDADAKAIAGVKAVVKIATGVAVVAETPWAAFNGKDALSVSWSKTGKAQGFDSDEAIEQFAAIARGEIAHSTDKSDVVGDVEAALRAAKETVTAEYRCDYAYHAQMEPLSAAASVTPERDALEIWCGTQSPTMAVAAAANAAKVSADKVTVRDMLLGGAFGRCGPRNQDFILDAIPLSSQLKRPIKVIWRREEDLHYGRFRPMSAHHVQVGFDSSGTLNAWHVRLVTDNVGLYQDPVRYYGPWHEKDMISFQGADLPTYAIPNRLAEHAKMDTGVRLSSLRGIGFTANKFVTEAFVDELAGRRGLDPVAFRLALLKDAPRARKVVQTVADMADWHRNRQDRALGIAYIDYSGSQIAGIAEISLDPSSGQIRVHNFWLAIDAGRAVQPDNIVAQVESCVVYGLGLALTERISFKDGMPQQSNFYDYIVMRMRDIPQIHTKVISTDNHPTGVGQMATPVVTPAVCNAVAALTGVRLRHSPMLPERVTRALKDSAPR